MVHGIKASDVRTPSTPETQRLGRAGICSWSLIKTPAVTKSQSIAKRLKRQIENGRKPSVSFLVKGVGLFVAGTEKIAPTVRDIVLYSIFIRTNAVRMGGIRTLNKRQEDFISNWESEAFRKKLATGKK